MYLPIIELYIFVFLVLERYCIERVMEQKAVDVLTFFDAVEDLNNKLDPIQKNHNEESIQATSLKLVATPVKPERVISKVDNESLDMFEQLQQELAMVGNSDQLSVIDNSDTYGGESYMDESMDHLLSQGAPDDEYLSIHDLKEDIQEQNRIQYVSSRISNETVGHQQWVVKVEDISDHEIFVNDGRKMWLNVGERKASRIKMGDLLQLDIERKGEEVMVDRIFRLENTLTDEYLIPDEFYALENIAVM